MKTCRLIFISAIAMTLVACGGKSVKTDFFGEEEKAKKPKVTTQTTLKRNWRVNLGKKISSGDAVISPVLQGDHIYGASTNGRVEKIVAQTGKSAWSVKFKKVTISAGVSVGSGLVLLASDQGTVYALAQDSGQTAWTAELNSEVLASPVVGNDIVVVRTGDGKVHGLATYDGEILWTISRQLPRLTLRGDSKPLISQGVVFTGFSDGTMAALEASSGRALWDFPISFPRGTNEIDRIADIDTTPLIVGGFLYISSYQEVTHALDIQNQRISWSAPVSSFHTLAFDAAFLYVSDRHGAICQIRRSDGEIVWSQEGLRLFSTSAPISVGPYVAVSDGDGSLYVLSKGDGSFVGKHKLGARTIVGDPIVDADTFYFIDSDGNLQSLSLQVKG